jgi:hypothetical protein
VLWNAGVESKANALAQPQNEGLEMRYVEAVRRGQLQAGQEEVKDGIEVEGVTEVRIFFGSNRKSVKSDLPTIRGGRRENKKCGW